ncbi:MAG: aldose 1-epimerase family protein [Flavobacteriales bacterium]
MKYSLENEFVKIEVKLNGAELCSYFNKQNNTEYVWQADPRFWGKHAPMLFPVIGMAASDQIKVKGQSFPMTKHGFARDMNFEFRSQTADTLEMALVSTTETKKSFPFDFELLVKYELKATKLITTFRVINKGQESMSFGIGGHPAFNCPDELENCFIEFEKEEKDDKVLINAQGFRNGKIVKDYINGKRIMLSKEIFKDDALIFLNLQSKAMVLQSRSGLKKLKFSHQGFPFLGIWAPVGAPFVCLEPWQGVCDTEGYSGEFKDKLGNVDLAPQKDFLCSYTIEGL